MYIYIIYIYNIYIYIYYIIMHIYNVYIYIIYTYIYIYIYIYILKQKMKPWKQWMCPPGYAHDILLVYWYQQCVTVHHMLWRMSCHKAIVVITGKAHYFHDYTYITSILLRQGLSTGCVVDLLWPLYAPFFAGRALSWFIGTSNE